MALSVALLTTKADCDKVLVELSDIKDNLEFRQISLTRSKDNAADRASSIDADLAAAEAEVTSLIAIIAALPEGSTKTEMQNRKVRADYKLFSLQQRKAQFGTTAVILYESELGEIEQRLFVIDNSMNEITIHKATLPAG
ncbi:hypothetical protein QNI19_38170 [Cytophagaceae bacterium DM2B3-1]|uniref:Uncharacterized protein n=1 Tax=Xanthocytophaga flava TaxID=3048013 RepID=A0ABT7D210_9BACT|nr:hypothetical protein [Xanthocytophaga flavus]MDJ1498298.1 hypothetical protein [Xanthocytophaga flavus]MDJ1498819.1 hypothetical protein [Xanthocytophaga flavus]